MNRDTVQSIAGAIASLGLAAISVILGRSLLPSRVAAQEGGIIVPWLLAWGLIGTAMLAGVILAGFLVVTAFGETHS